MLGESSVYGSHIQKSRSGARKRMTKNVNDSTGHRRKSGWLRWVGLASWLAPLAPGAMSLLWAILKYSKCSSFKLCLCFKLVIFSSISKFFDMKAILGDGAKFLCENYWNPHNSNGVAILLEWQKFRSMRILGFTSRSIKACRSHSSLGWAIKVDFYNYPLIKYIPCLLNSGC